MVFAFGYMASQLFQRESFINGFRSRVHRLFHEEGLQDVDFFPSLDVNLSGLNSPRLAAKGSFTLGP